MNAVHGSIIENLKLVEIIYEGTVEPFKKDRTNTSDSKEVTLNEFIRSYFPSDYEIKLRSKIYSRTQETKNIDCIVLSPNHPKLITPKREVILAEGVHSAIEVKPNIVTLTEKGEFYKGLLQIQSVKKLTRDTEKIEFWRLIKGKKPSDYFDRIPCVLFSSKSSELEKIVKFLVKKINQKKIGIQELPDIIVSLNKGVIAYCPVFKETKLGIHLESEGIDVLESAFVTYSSPEKTSILVLFLQHLVGFSLPHIQMSSFIIKKYLDDIQSDFEIKLYNLEGKLKKNKPL